MFEECWEVAVFEPSGGGDGVEDIEDTCVYQEGNAATFNIFEFVPLVEIKGGGACSHDKQ